MLIPGHVSVGYLLTALHARTRVPSRPPRLRGEVLPALFGSLTPDLIDKPLLLAGVFAHGRNIGHSLTFLLAGLAVFAVGRRRGRSFAAPMGMWLLGIASHFVADLADDLVRGVIAGSLVFSTWFAWPFATPSTWDYRPGYALLPGYSGLSPLEVATTLLALLVAYRLGVRREARSD